MGGNPQIARLRIRANRAEELAAKLEKTNAESQLMRKVIANIHSDVRNLRGLIFFLETAQKHDRLVRS